MERSGNDNKDVNYLDVRVVIDADGKFSTELYNKLNDFNFPVVMYTFPHGNMPVNVGYNVFYSQVLRFSNICSQLDSFLKEVNQLYRLLTGRAYDSNKLKKTFKDLMLKRPEILLKYKISDIQEIEELAFVID